MPELPEVETVRRGLAPEIVGRKVTSAVVRRGDLRIPVPEGFGERLKGRRITALRRRAKYLIADLSSGESLIIHLGMSGRLLWSERERASAAVTHQAFTPKRHDHVVLEFGDTGRLVFNDARRFGLMALAPTANLNSHALFAHLGVEPMDASFDGQHLERSLAGRRTSIKSALLDQSVVVGIGNIYASESLHRARISPRRMANCVRGVRAVRLAEAVRDVLRQAIKAGGSSLRDYVHADGTLGYFQHGFAVYDREGESCGRHTCAGTTIRRIVQSNRSTFYCPRCQR